MEAAPSEHLGTRVHCCRCSLPGLTGLTVYRCEGPIGPPRKKPYCGEPRALLQAPIKNRHKCNKDLPVY